MDKRAINQRLNGLKDTFPKELALIEGIQMLFNKRVEVISETNKRALRMYPIQFTRRIDTGNGEWTTTLHLWADNLVDTLLEIDPLMLTTSDSHGTTVLHALVDAALGKFTQQVDYDFIQKLLDKNMSFIEMLKPGDPNSKVEGNAWLVKDPCQKTAMDYLVDFANGDESLMPDDRLVEMLQAFSQSVPTEAPVDNTPTEIPTEEPQVQSPQAGLNDGPAPQPDMTTQIQDQQLEKEAAGTIASDQGTNAPENEPVRQPDEPPSKEPTREVMLETLRSMCL